VIVVELVLGNWRVRPRYYSFGEGPIDVVGEEPEILYFPTREILKTSPPSHIQLRKQVIAALVELNAYGSRILCGCSLHSKKSTVKGNTW